MDHVSVRDAYHVWHGVSDLNDALQAPPNLTHFDGYFMGPHTESPYKPGEHIPGLNVGAGTTRAISTTMRSASMAPSRISP